jgi:hypothetical protein
MDSPRGGRTDKKKKGIRDARKKVKEKSFSITRQVNIEHINRLLMAAAKKWTAAGAEAYIMY